MARETIVRPLSEQSCGGFRGAMPRAASPAIWRIGGCRRDGPEGRESPPRGSSGRAAEPLDPHYRANPCTIQVKLISRRRVIEAFSKALRNARTNKVRHIAAQLADFFDETGRDELVLVGGHQEHGLHFRVQPVIHTSHLKFVFEI